jgi:hypothetical protein
LLVAKSLYAVERIKKDLKEKFEMIDFGEATTILGTKIRGDWKNGTLTLEQTDDVDNLHKRKHYGLRYTRTVDDPLIIGNLRGYCNIVWAGDKDSYVSMAGLIFVMNGGAISWKCNACAVEMPR